MVLEDGVSESEKQLDEFEEVEKEIECVQLKVIQDLQASLTHASTMNVVMTKNMCLIGKKVEILGTKFKASQSQNNMLRYVFKSNLLLSDVRI
jgi:GTP-sensing pleiotropic transcriptional regulator CodY